MPDLARARLELCLLLPQEEGQRSAPYLCQAGVPTIGFGATTYPDGRRVRLTDPPITAEQMQQMLQIEVDRYMGAVVEMVGEHCTTNQLIALTSCAYNIGVEGMRGSSMIRLHRAGDYAAAARAFALWNKIRGPDGKLIVSPGLEARRRREAAKYGTPDMVDPSVVQSPQAAAPEPTLGASTITQGGAAVSTVGAVVTAAQVLVPEVEAMRDIAAKVRALVVDVIGLPLDAFTKHWPVLLIALGGWIVWQRYKRRREGWI